MRHNTIRYGIGLLMLLLTLSVNLRGQNSSSDWQRAIDLFERGRWSDARHEFLRIQSDLKSASPLEKEQVAYYLAVCAVELGHRDAEVALLNFEKHYPGSMLTNDIRFARASYYCTQGEFEKARKAFDATNYRALSVDNRNKYDIRRGYLDFAAGEYDAAYGYFERVDEKSPYADHALYYRSYIDYTREEYDRAKVGFQRLSHSEAYRNVAPFYLLQIEFRQGNYLYVTSHGDALIETAAPRQQCDLRRMMAESWFHLNDYNRALSYILAYRESGGEATRDAAYIEGFSLYRLARYEQAAEALRQVAGPDDALTQNAAYHLADCYLRADKKQEAMQAFAMATNRSLNEALAEDALYNYGKLQYELGGGLFSEAIRVLSRYLEEYPQSSRQQEVQTLLAAAYYNSENYDAAYEAIRLLAAPDAEIRAARQKITYFRALQHFEQGEWEEAERRFRESIEIGVTPRFTSLAGFWLGEIAFARGEYPQATRAFEQYLQRAPRQEREYPLAHYNLGYCYLQQQQIAQAEQHFSSFLSLSPESDLLRADARCRLGDCQYRQRNFEGALQSYETASRSEEIPHYYAEYQRAITLGILERSSQKVEALQSIVAADRGDFVDEATFELGRTRVSRGEYQEGAEILSRFVEQYPHSPNRLSAWADLGLIYTNLGDRQQALHYYGEVVKESPSSAEGRGALQRIRDLYVAEGDIESYFAYAEEQGVKSDLSERSRDSLTFASAQRLYLANRHEDAARSLRSYIKTYPEGDYTSDALYYLGNCYRQEGDAAHEMETLRSLVAQGQTPYRVESLSRLAPLAEEQRAYTVAAEAYRQLSRYATQRQERQVALDHYLRLIEKSGNEEQTLQAARTVEAHKDVSAKSLRRARYLQADIHRRRGEQDQALALYNLLCKEVRSNEGGEAMYRLIEAKMETGDWKQTEEMVFTFSEMPSPNNYWLANAFLLLGDCYCKQGDNFQARATYQSIVDGYAPANDGVIEAAKARIAQLKE